MPSSRLVYVDRERPFEIVLSIALGDDFKLRFPLKDENNANITTGTVTVATLEIRDKPAAGENFADKTLRASIAQAAMTVSLPNIDVPVNVTADVVDWTSQAKGDYWAKFSLKMDGRKVTPSEFAIKITD